MGGFGSGNRSSWGCKTKVEHVNKIDISYLKRTGRLEPGVSGLLSWTNGRELCGSIKFSTQQDKIILSYRARTNGMDWQEISETVYFDISECHFGGYRKWFSCPSCAKRVGILHGAGTHFLCRHCHNLTYSSQSEELSARMFRKARKIRDRLGASRDITMPIYKPKGMHWKTFNKLVDMEQQASNAGSYAIAEMFNLTDKL